MTKHVFTHRLDVPDSPVVSLTRKYSEKASKSQLNIKEPLSYPSEPIWNDTFGGFGLFAKTDLPAGTKVERFEGLLISSF
jgi:hypothetical protein